jgi:hypothetical protein
MKSNTDTLLYRRQMVEMAMESKKFLKIPAAIIQNTPNDSELGSVIRGIYIQRVKDADDHIAYIKSLEN